MVNGCTPIPGLPLEVIGHVLRFCDARTLAVSSRASLALLELAGPLLYRDIVTRGGQQLEKLVRSQDVLASIAPFLSFAQTRTLTHQSRSGHFSRSDISRRLSPQQIDLDQLELDLRHTHPGGDWAFRLDILLASVDPRHVHILGLSDTHGNRVKRYLDIPRSLPWTQLRSLRFTNANPSGHRLAETPGIADSFPLTDLDFDLSARECEGEEDSLQANLAWIHNSLEGRENRTSPAFGVVRVWVDDEEEVTVAEGILVDCSCTSMEIKARDDLTRAAGLPD